MPLRFSASGLQRRHEGRKGNGDFTWRILRGEKTRTECYLMYVHATAAWVLDEASLAGNASNNNRERLRLVSRTIGLKMIRSRYQPSTKPIRSLGDASLFISQVS